MCLILLYLGSMNDFAEVIFFFFWNIVFPRGNKPVSPFSFSFMRLLVFTSSSLSLSAFFFLYAECRLGRWCEPVNICLRYSGRSSRARLRWGGVHVNHPWRWTVTAISKSTILLLSKVHPLLSTPFMCVRVSSFSCASPRLSVCVCFRSQIT